MTVLVAAKGDGGQPEDPKPHEPSDTTGIYKLGAHDAND